jgi:hypothetical protein
MHARPSQYHAYLLRIWQEAASETAVWRFSLEDPSSGQRLGFADLAALVAFLHQQTSATHGSETGDQRSETGDQRPEI